MNTILLIVFRCLRVSSKFSLIQSIKQVEYRVCTAHAQNLRVPDYLNPSMFSMSFVAQSQLTQTILRKIKKLRKRDLKFHKILGNRSQLSHSPGEVK